MNKVHVKTGDTVKVISGKDRGETGKVLAVSPKEGKVIVEGLNMVKKHVKPRRQGETGGIVDAEGAIYASKVMPVCPKCGKRMTERKSKAGKIYYSCEDYTNCKFMSWDEPTGKLCPKCNEHIVNKTFRGKTQTKCSNKDCDYIEQ